LHPDNRIDARPDGRSGEVPVRDDPAAERGAGDRAGPVPAGDRPDDRPERRCATFADLAGLIRTRPPRLGAVRLVAVDGPSGAGKTSFAQRLAEELTAPVVHTDDLLDGWDDQFTFWARLESQVLQPLRHGRSAHYRRYLWDRGGFGGAPLSIEPADAVLIEGVSSARRVIRTELSLSVFVVAPAELRWSRALARDGGDDLAFRAYLERWRLAEDRHFAEDDTAAHVDLVVDGAAPVCDDGYEQLWRRPPN
jgi:uridine kinase